MKNFSIPIIMLTLAFTMSVVSLPGYAAVTNKVILKIEGMT